MPTRVSECNPSSNCEMNLALPMTRRADFYDFIKLLSKLPQLPVHRAATRESEYE